MTRFLRHRRLLAIVPALLMLVSAVGAGAPPAAAADPTVTGAACAPGVGVTVVVDYQELGQVEIGCAPGIQADGFAALANAGFTINEDGGPVGGTVCQIRSVPAAGYPTCWYDGFWGYWKSDGAQSWMWSETGASAGPLAINRVEAWSWTSPVPADYSGTLPRVAVADLASYVPVVLTSQTIAFPVLPDAALGGAPIELTATATSTLAVTYAATGQCSVSGSTLTLSGAGSCAVTAAQAGNAQWAPAEPVQRTFAISVAPDVTAPVITVASAPPATTSATTASIVYSVDDPTAAVQFRLDGGTWAAATSPLALSGLGVGAHTVDLRATDPASNAGAASVSWTVSGARDCATGPLIPDLGVLDARDILPVRSTDLNAVEVAVLTDLAADPGTASYQLATQLDLSAYVGQKVRVVARIAGDPCVGAPTFNAVYDVRSAYAPRWSLADAPGSPSPAVPGTSPSIKAWPSAYESYVPGPNVTDGFKTPSRVVGQTGLVVLGDHGRIDLRFDVPIADGEGADLSVMENGFATGSAAAQLDFLEFGRVAVSSDGVHFATFDSASRRAAPVGPYVGQSAAEIGGLAGKDLAGRGTPFDLANLRNSPEVRGGLVDLSRIALVRIVDVVGDGNDLDSFGRPIYDPFPSYGSGGFDLTGVAALNLAPTPLLAITSGPAALTRETSATVAFTTTPAEGIDIECRVDAGEWATCASPFAADGVVDGQHTIDVRSRWNAASEWATASASWTVDTTAPVVAITASPETVAPQTSASIAFTVDDAAAAVTCAVDGGAPAPCVSPMRLSGLTDGGHSVLITATDLAGNSGTATAAWTIKQPVPPVARVSVSSARVGDEATVTGSGFEAGEQVSITFNSTPVLLATIEADGLGAVTHTFAVPRVEAGPHAIVLAGLDSELTASAPLEVLADAATDSGTPTPTPTPAPLPPSDGNGSAPAPNGAGGPLARTGADTVGWALVGGLLVFLGAAAAWAARRRTRNGFLPG